MNSLISINRKFMDVPIDELINMIKKSNNTKGVEIYIDYHDEFERDYLEKIVPVLKQNDLILQIHGEVELDFDEQLKYMNKIAYYSNIVGYPIVVTLHPRYDEDLKVSYDITKDYLDRLVKEIDLSKIIIGLENLNDWNGMIRLTKEELEPIILENENINFTYDIGHELEKFRCMHPTSLELTNKVVNIHIHTTEDGVEDHQPIYEGDKYWSVIENAFSYMKEIDYNKNLVFEYDVLACKGNSIEEKIINYLNSIDFVTDYFNK